MSLSENGFSQEEPSDVSLVLGRIRASLLGDSENLLVSTWNLSRPLCSWRGLGWGFADGSAVNCDDASSSLTTNLSLARDPRLRLLSLRLPAAGLSGEIPREIGELSALHSLYLGVNSLSGTIPLELGNSPSLADVDLRDNSLSGSLPPSIWNLCSRLVSLRLGGNNFTGVVPEPAVPNSSCADLQSLDLGGNSLQGRFPEFVTNFHQLTELNLADNHLSGAIPDQLSQLLSLQRLNLSYNNFTGQVPAGLARFSADAFVGNAGELCGSPLRSCRGSSGLSSGAIAGIVIGLMAGLVILASISIGLVQGRRRKNRAKDLPMDDMDGEDLEGDEGEGKLLVFQGGEHLTLEDVLNATGQVMEKTSYGTVYKAKLVDGGTIALRLLREGSCKDRAACLPFIKQLGRVRHENLVPLRAFYQGQRGEKLLIYDYLPNKTLHDLLHGL